MVRIFEIIDIDNDKLRFEVLSNDKLVKSIMRVYDLIIQHSDDLQIPPNKIYRDTKTIHYIKSVLDNLYNESMVELDSKRKTPSQCTRICKYLLNYF